MANIIVRLAQTPEEKRQTLNEVLDLRTGRAARTEATKLAALAVQLDPEPGDKRQALDAVLARLDQTPDDTEATKLATLVVQLDPEPGDKRRACDALLARQIAAALAVGLVAAILQLDPEPEDKRKVRGALLTLLTKHATGAESAGEAALWLFAGHAEGSLGAELAALVVQLDLSNSTQHPTTSVKLSTRCSSCLRGIPPAQWPPLAWRKWWLSLTPLPTTSTRPAARFSTCSTTPIRSCTPTGWQPA
jgi:hypothetical protein